MCTWFYKIGVFCVIFSRQFCLDLCFLYAFGMPYTKQVSTMTTNCELNLRFSRRWKLRLWLSSFVILCCGLVRWLPAFQTNQQHPSWQKTWMRTECSQVIGRLVATQNHEVVVVGGALCGPIGTVETETLYLPETLVSTVRMRGVTTDDDGIHL